MFGQTPEAWPASHRLARRAAGRAGLALSRSGPAWRAVVRVTGPARAQFRFLPGFDSNDVYTWPTACPG